MGQDFAWPDLEPFPRIAAPYVMTTLKCGALQTDAVYAEFSEPSASLEHHKRRNAEAHETSRSKRATWFSFEAIPVTYPGSSR